MNCEHRETQWRRLKTANGAVQIKRQCVECGRTVSSAIRHAEVKNITGVEMDALPEYDSELQETYWRKQRVALDGLREMRSVVRKAEFAEYLASAQWRRIRALVLKRDHGICQGCLEAEATKVHHLTYEHVGHELAFELVSLCTSCHEKIHDR